MNIVQSKVSMKVFKKTLPSFDLEILKSEALKQGWTPEQFNRSGIDTKFLRDEEKNIEFTVSLPETEEERYDLFSEQYSNPN